MDRINKLKEFLQASPGDSFLQHALALEYVKLGREEEAQSLFIAILDRDPSYIGSYYHLGKLYERSQENEKAIEVYDRGMKYAKQAGDNHAFSELRNAMDELID